MWRVVWGSAGSLQAYRWGLLCAIVVGIGWSYPAASLGQQIRHATRQVTGDHHGRSHRNGRRGRGRKHTRKLRLVVATRRPTVGNTVTVDVIVRMSRVPRKRERYVVAFGDGPKHKGRGVPNRLRHVYQQHGTFRVRLRIRGRERAHASVTVHVHIRRRHTPPHRRQQPAWLTLPGTMLSYSDVAVLTAEDFNGFTGGGILWALGTRSGGPVEIHFREGLPASTSDEVMSTLMTDAAPEHPLGLAVITLKVTFPQSGINPPHSVGYFSVFDASTGDHISTSASFNWESIDGSLIGYVKDDVRVGTEEFTTIDPAGHVSETAYPGEPRTPGYPGSSVVGPPVAGRILIGGYGQPGDECPIVYVVEVATEKTLSQTPCLPKGISIDNGKSSNYYFDGSVFGVPDTPAFFRATGGQLTGAGQLGNESASFIYPGARSDLTVVQNEGFSYFVSINSWTTVFTATPEQTFAPYGIADDDVWVDTSHWEGVEYIGGHIVINGHTGAQLSGNWKVYPIAGGEGWTLTSTPDTCCTSKSEYLLRSTGTLLASLNSVP